MKTSDKYHKWVELSEEDQVYLGKWPDLITGIHGDDPVQVYADLCEIVEDVIEHLESAGCSLASRFAAMGSQSNPFSPKGLVLLPNSQRAAC